MTQTDKTLLALIKCAVCGWKNVSNIETDWLSVFALSNKQAVSVLAADGLQKLLSLWPNIKPFANEIQSDRQMRLQWLGQVMSYERLYARHEKAMTDLARLYASKGIRMMVLKDYGLSLDWEFFVRAHHNEVDWNDSVLKRNRTIYFLRSNQCHLH